MRACKLGKRHKWTHKANINKTTYRGSYVQISRVGVYECACGERKHGAASMEFEQ